MFEIHLTAGADIVEQQRPNDFTNVGFNNIQRVLKACLVEITDLYNWIGHLATKVKPPEMTNLGYQYGRQGRSVLVANCQTDMTYFFYLQPNPKTKLKI